MTDLDCVPGFRRRIHIQPAEGRVRAAVEDDFHRMAVTLIHDGVTVQRVDAEQDRAPWTTCPGAVAELEACFTGALLVDFPARGEKRRNCTHLYDMALLAALHAGDEAPITYDILVSDDIDRRMCEIRRDGLDLLGFVYAGHVLVEPKEVAGTPLIGLRGWIETLDPALQEPARLLQWGAIIAHGRTIPLADQSDATRIPPNCYTFQPERASRALRVGKIVDFSGAGAPQPLG